MSAAPSLKDLRRHIRYEPEAGTHQFLPGVLVSASHKQIPFRLVDYSLGGLGIRTTEALLPELDFTLVTSNPDGQPGKDIIYLSLVWGMHLTEKNEGYRYGLKVTGGEDILRRVFNIIPE